jgi:hypothetical protein
MGRPAKKLPVAGMNTVGLDRPPNILPGGVTTRIHRHYHVVNCFRYSVLSLQLPSVSKLSQYVDQYRYYRYLKLN